MEKNNALYSSTVEIKQGIPIDYPDALRKLDSRDDVYILPPTKGFKEYIFLFPGVSSEKFSNNEVIEYPHKNYIFYKTKWYEPEGIFKKIPIEHKKGLYIGNIFVALSFYEKCLKGKNYYKFPYSYFDFTTSKQNEFRQKAIQPIRYLLSSVNLLTPDNRGKGAKEKREIRQRIQGVVIKAFKKARRKRPIPVAFIQSQITTELEKIFPDDPALCDKHVVSDNTIRRILKREGIV